MKRLLLLAALLAAGQEEKTCDLAKSEMRFYCQTCRIWPPSDKIEKSACAKCRCRIEKLDTCIKYYWDCPAVHGSPRRHANPCGAAPDCCKEKPSLSLVWKVCGDCRARALKEPDVKHTKEDCAGKTARECGLGGRYPHGGQED